MTKILVIEDEQFIREDVCTLLEFEGFTVSSAENGRVALALLPGFAPDAIVCDLVMPEMDGITFLQHMRAMPGFAATPLIFMSAKTLPQDIESGLKAGASAYLRKPFNADELLNALATLT
jgi:CheY-like chemotaxis protein